MRFIISMAFLLLLSGCVNTTTTKAVHTSTYQFVMIKGDPYVLDQRSGRLYAVEPNGKGFDISRPVGEVGSDYRAY